MNENGVQSISAETFPELVRTKARLLVKFSAPWCVDCARFEPVFARAAARHPHLSWAEINTDEAQQLAAALNITSIPTVIAIKNQNAIARRSGIIQGIHLDTMAAALTENKE